jgi:hypothetical protein
MDVTTMAKMSALDALVGEWTMEAIFPNGGSGGVTGHTTFSWTLGGSFLLQRAEVPHPDAPDVVALIGRDGSDGFIQHYFDSRGVIREYAMTLRDNLWTLLRLPPAPDFSQRFQASIDLGAGQIAGAWEIKSDGLWKHDFDLIYTRVDS